MVRWGSLALVVGWNRWLLRQQFPYGWRDWKRDTERRLFFHKAGQRKEGDRGQETKDK